MAVQIGTENIIGRDSLVKQIWKKLEKGSLRFTAERRIGKTTVMKLLLSQKADTKVLRYIDLERIDSPDRFVEVLLTEIKPLFSRTEKTKVAFKSLLTAIGGTEIAGIVKIPEHNTLGWQQLLEKSFDGICTNNSDIMIVLLFDELPYMLQKIAAKEKQSDSNEHAALELIDTLRAMRNKHENLRMIFAGSVGLHHVLGSLRGTDFASQPVNDMSLVPILPLNIEDAKVLASHLLKNEKVDIDEDDKDLLPAELARLTDCVPFYLERVISRLSEIPPPVSINHAREIVQNHLAGDYDEWEMEHFRERLKIYYLGETNDISGKLIENSKIAATILDILAVTVSPQTIDEIWNAVKAKLALDDKDLIIKLLSLLARDHYLKGDSKKDYSFRFPLIKKWWSLAQGLSI